MITFTTAPLTKLIIRLQHVLGLAVLCLLLTGSLKAQNSTGGSTPAAMAGGAPAGSYALSDFDTVNLFNGNLNFRLPLLGISGRGGARHSIALPIESKWSVQKFTSPGPDETFAWVPQPYYAGMIKVGYGPGVLRGYHSGYQPQYCVIGDYTSYLQTQTKLTFTNQDGTEYELLSQNLQGGLANNSAYRCEANYAGYNRGTIFKTNDGSGATFISDTNIHDHVVPDGNDDPQFPFYPQGICCSPTAHAIASLTAWLTGSGIATATKSLSLTMASSVSH